MLEPMLLVRVSYRDILLAWEAVDHTSKAGKGGLRYAALRRSVSPSVVKEALDRVERAFGGTPFFVARSKRLGSLTPAGVLFHDEGFKLIGAWARAAQWRPHEEEGYDPSLDE